MIFPELLKPDRVMHSKNASKVLRAPRQRIMIHFDDSGNDASGENWFMDPRCGVSYNRWYGDAGRIVSIADDDWAAWHAGKCLTLEANSVYWGQAAATNATIPATQRCVDTMIEDSVRFFYLMKWPAVDVERRIIGHDREAIFNKKDNPTRPDLWGKLGRRIDPTGFNPQRPIIDLKAYRRTVGQLLLNRSPTAPPVVLVPVPVPAPVAPGSMRPFLKLGSKNAVAVAELQALLGMNDLTSPGTFGPLTESKVKAFQRKHGLDADGKVGDKTWAKLLGG